MSERERVGEPAPMPERTRVSEPVSVSEPRLIPEQTSGPEQTSSPEPAQSMSVRLAGTAPSGSAPLELTAVLPLASAPAPLPSPDVPLPSEPPLTRASDPVVVAPEGDRGLVAPAWEDPSEVPESGDVPQAPEWVVVPTMMRRPWRLRGRRSGSHRRWIVDRWTPCRRWRLRWHRSRSRTRGRPSRCGVRHRRLHCRRLGPHRFRRQGARHPTFPCRTSHRRGPGYRWFGPRRSGRRGFCRRRSRHLWLRRQGSRWRGIPPRRSGWRRSGRRGFRHRRCRRR